MPEKTKVLIAYEGSSCADAVPILPPGRWSKRPIPGGRIWPWLGVESLLSRETRNEQEILEVTGLPPAPDLDTGMLPVLGGGSRSTPRNGS
jgi:hypothetical protein